MLFNSLAFALFLPLVYLVYWSLPQKSVRWQNLLILCASYLFYGWWDYRFLSLIIVSSITDYIVGLSLDNESRIGRRKLLLLISVVVNLGLLGFFKYFGFFVQSFADLLAAFGLQANMAALRIILPVGISFYTFQTMSYTIDIYFRKIGATRDVISFFAFVSFFPQLVAGPIERASNLLPQFQSRRHFDRERAVDGLRQMLYGLFKKIVIADNLARYVNEIFASPAGLDSVILFIGVFLFAFQIYCDFSGYSDIAIGVARLFGFKLMRNFAFPYFSRDIGEFWRKWHISLSSWFRDYVYIPLGGSRTTPRGRLKNIFVTFTVSGFWHGANWTFIIWGMLHGLYYTPVMLFGKQNRFGKEVAARRFLPGFREFGAITITFLLVLLAWIFFRAESLTSSIHYIAQLFSPPYFNGALYHGQYVEPLLFCIVLIAIEWFQRDKQHGLEIGHWPRPTRWLAYYAVCMALLLFGNFGEVSFIYFQF